MEIEVVRRRIHKIAGHFVPPTNDDIISSATQLLPRNCSNSLNSVIRRCDNRTYFARQASSAQACFMRQSSSKQSICTASEAPLFARCSLPLKSYGFTTEDSGNASEAPLFARPSLSLNCFRFMNEVSSNAYEAPLFSTPARMETNNANCGLIQPPVQDCVLSTPDLPKFAKPNRRIHQEEKFHSKDENYSSEPKGIEESPRMDVRELRCNYVMIIEIPGVGMSDIRVEVDDQNLIVMAKHSAKSWQATGCLNSTISAYHRKKYREEPYRVVWPLPIDVNRDTISAEFLNGLLQIIMPKL